MNLILHLIKPVFTLEYFLLLVISHLSQTNGASVTSWSEVLGFPMSWWNTDNQVWHLEKDQYKHGNILFSEERSLKTTDGITTEVIVGRELGYKEGMGTEAEFISISSFAQISITSVILTDFATHCLRIIDRINKTTQTFAGQCTESGEQDGVNSKFDKPHSLLLVEGGNTSIIVDDILLVTDYNNNAIRKVDIQTRNVSTVIKDQELLDGPRGIVSDMIIPGVYYITVNTGLIKLKTADHPTLERITSSRQKGYMDGHADEAMFNEPNGIIHLVGDTFLIADTRNNKVRLLNMGTQDVSTLCTMTQDDDEQVCEMKEPNSVLVVDGSVYIGERKGIQRMLDNSAECGVRKNKDILIIIDSTTSVARPDFRKQKEFVIELINQFEIGPDYNNVGVISFSTDSKLEIPLNPKSSKTQLKQQLQRIRQMGGGTNTHKALQSAYNLFYSSDGGARVNMPKAILLLTDGMSYEPNETDAAAQQLRDSGVQIIAVGIGFGVNTERLSSITNDVANVYLMGSFSGLERITSHLCCSIFEGCIAGWTCTELSSDLLSNMHVKKLKKRDNCQSLRYKCSDGYEPETERTARCLPSPDDSHAGLWSTDVWPPNCKKSMSNTEVVKENWAVWGPVVASITLAFLSGITVVAFCLFRRFKHVNVERRENSAPLESAGKHVTQETYHEYITTTRQTNDWFSDNNSTHSSFYDSLYEDEMLTEILPLSTPPGVLKGSGGSEGNNSYLSLFAEDENGNVTMESGDPSPPEITECTCY